jgi:2-methylisocitrate lyase-like PEP mutase family enzyme
MAARRFPAPWTVEAIDAGFKVIDANGQGIAYVYGHADKRDAETAKGLILDEARRIASNIAKLPTLLAKGSERAS